MKAIRRVICLLLIFALTLSFCGCGGINSNAIIYYELAEAPVNIDPQLAYSDSELLLVRNLFEGLLRVNENGEVVNAVANEYTFKDNFYTFTLNESAMWSDGTPLTAYDFEFAFKRAVSPETKAPFAEKLSCILNAELIMNGSVSPKELGVTAVDQSTLIIRVTYNDDEFLNTLASSVCMPCNEEFFNSCNGQYGLNKDNIITNGSYRLTKWSTETTALRIYRSTKYFGNFPAKNTAVYLSYKPDVKNIVKLKDSTVDIAYIDLSSLKEITDDSIVLKQSENILWVVKFSDAFSYDLRNAFISSIYKDGYGANLSEGYTVAKSFLPASITDRDYSNIGMPVYDIKAAKKLFEAEIKKLDNKRLPSTTMYYYREEGMERAVTDIVAHWQGQLGAYINIQPCDSMGQINQAVATKGNYIAIYPVYITDDDFSILSSKLGYDFKNSGLTTIAEMQTAIMSDCRIAPIAFQNSIIGCTSDIVDFNFSLGNGLIDFAYVTKK